MLFSEANKLKLQKCNDIKIAALKKSQSERHREAQLRSFVRQEGGEVQRKMRNLNRQFERDISRLENSVSVIEVPEKSLAAKWICKLKAHPHNLNEAIARNYILTYLLQGSLFQAFKKKPFNNPPPPNNLTTIKAVMPPIVSKKQNVHDLFKSSADNGAFLFNLSVPRDGAFFVLHLRPNFI